MCWYVNACLIFDIFGKQVYLSDWCNRVFSFYLFSVKFERFPLCNNLFYCVLLSCFVCVNVCGLVFFRLVSPTRGVHTPSTFAVGCSC